MFVCLSVCPSVGTVFTCFDLRSWFLHYITDQSLQVAVRRPAGPMIWQVGYRVKWQCRIKVLGGPRLHRVMGPILAPPVVPYTPLEVGHYLLSFTPGKLKFHRPSGRAPGSETDCFAQPRPTLSFGQWVGGGARTDHSWIRHCA